MENQKEISWQIPDNHHLPKRFEFLVALGIVALALGIASLLFKNYLFIILLALGTFIIYASLKKEARLINFKINEIGVFIDEKIHPWESFESFWIFDAPNPELALRSKKHFMPLILIPIKDVNLEELADFLSKHLEVREEKESIIDLFRKNFF